MCALKRSHCPTSMNKEPHRPGSPISLATGQGCARAQDPAGEGFPQQRKALLRKLVKELRVTGRRRVEPTYKVPALVRAPGRQVKWRGLEPHFPVVGMAFFRLNYHPVPGGESSHAGNNHRHCDNRETNLPDPPGPGGRSRHPPRPGSQPGTRGGEFPRPDAGYARTWGATFRRALSPNP